MLEELKQTIDQMRNEAKSVLDAASDSEALESFRNAYLGRKGKVRDLFAMMGNVAAEARSEAGQAVNAFKNELEGLFEARSGGNGGSAKASGPMVDVTLPGTRPPIGRLHPVYECMDDIVSAFVALGFDVALGPEIEDEFHNFEALNIPADHPARDGFDTYYVDGKNLLRSHTSPVQIRTMMKRKPPLRVIAPGRVYRPDTPDASHSPMFHQVEGLMVGEDVSFANLKGLLLTFAREFFGAETDVRFRPSFFPFTEPSGEVDISCIICGGGGCSACKHSGWMEILGAGMVDPAVYDAVGYDATNLTGFAFGMGVERIAMLRHGITDIRLFTENHREFLEQF
jgi:phenylalanyl-tRNA synthetase alpha chain